MILNKFNLEGKSGIVTGGGSGIGKGMAAGWGCNETLSRRIEGTTEAETDLEF